jgi:type I restriction enzyme, S subunit
MLKPYERYRPSGVEWLGNVPEHWETSRLGYLAEKIGSGKTPKGGAETYQADGILLIRSQNVHDSGLRLADVAFIDESIDEEMAGTRVAPHDVLLNITGASLGRCSIAPKDLPPANVNQHVCIVRISPSKAIPRFVQRALSSRPVHEQIFSFENGSSREGLNFQQVRSLILGVPSIAEQHSIADFLDRETAKIDTLMTKKRALIEKLREKRTALISRTVTRGLPPAAARAAGLNPHPALKLTGIEWFNDVPRHWSIGQLKRNTVILDCMHRTVSFVDEGIPLASIREVHGTKVDLSNAKQTTEEEYLGLLEGGRRPRLGDIIYSRNATVGDAAMVTTNERFAMGQDVCLIRSGKHDPKYLLYMLRSEPLLQQLESFMVGATFRRINVGDIKTFWLCWPPISEQRAIADFLDLETSGIDRMVAKVETAIERLQEYRTALITAAVTGKIDVRGTAA